MPDRHIPLAALLLGVAGVVPFLGLAGTVHLGPPPWNFVAASLLTGYGIAILSFMGGVHWGLALRDGRPVQYAVSVLPALYAWPAAMLDAAAGWAYLAAGFVALLAFDLWAGRRSWTTPWYGRLRSWLTLAAAGSLAAAALA